MSTRPTCTSTVSDDPPRPGPLLRGPSCIPVAIGDLTETGDRTSCAPTRGSAIPGDGLRPGRPTSLARARIAAGLHQAVAYNGPSARVDMTTTEERHRVPTLRSGRQDLVDGERGRKGRSGSATSAQRRRAPPWRLPLAVRGRLDGDGDWTSSPARWKTNGDGPPRWYIWKPDDGHGLEGARDPRRHFLEATAVVGDVTGKELDIIASGNEKGRAGRQAVHHALGDVSE